VDQTERPRFCCAELNSRLIARASLSLAVIKVAPCSADWMSEARGRKGNALLIRYQAFREAPCTSAALRAGNYTE